jgi:hypothetical protein
MGYLAELFDNPLNSQIIGQSILNIEIRTINAGMLNRASAGVMREPK